eukprot:XP_014038105.1 PREDICTED: basigin-like [Salmo salar]
MALRTAGSVLVVFLWSVTVVLGQIGGSVTYTTQSICTLNWSTVELTCSYTYPSGTVTTTFWFTKNDAAGPVSLSDDPDYKGRVTYRSDKTNGHTLTITDLRERDSAMYKFRFITDQTGGKYIGSPGVTLSVTDLQVKVTTTWWSTTLTCSTTCTLTGNPTYIWYRNSKIVQEDSSPSYSVYLQTEESFYCVVKGINSPAVYGPKNTSVSVSPSGEIVEGSSVNLTCSSDANPPVDKYTWYKTKYKKMAMRHSGQRYTIHNISSEDREGYYCEALNIIGRETIPVHINVISMFPWVPVVGVGAVLTAGALLVTIYYTRQRRHTGGSDATADTQIKGLPCDTAPQKDAEPSDYENGREPPQNLDSDTAPQIDAEHSDYENWSEPPQNLDSDTAPQIDAEPSDYENWSEPPQNLDSDTAPQIDAEHSDYENWSEPPQNLDCDTAPQIDAEPSDYENWSEPPQNLDSDTAPQIDAEPSDYENWSEPPQNLDSFTAPQIDAEPSDYENWSEPPQNLD